MGKYSKNKKQNRRKKKSYTGRKILLAVLLVLLVMMVYLAVWLGQQDAPVPEQTDGPQVSGTVGTVATAEPTQAPETLPEVTDPQPIELSDGLVIHYISSYTGIYMEDGTDDVVSEVMMLVLENTSAEDLQLARISIEYTDFTAEFEVTNIPAGEKVVALERNRHPETSEEFLDIQVSDVVFYQEAMSLCEDRIRITGANGSLEVENISGENITGDIYIYYKNSASDLFYGGITYRVAVRGGLDSGQIVRVIAGHYTINGSRILLVECRA